METDGPSAMLSSLLAAAEDELNENEQKAPVN